MLRFKAYQNGVPAKAVDLDGACLIGPDRVPLRAELKFSKGEIVCDARTKGTAALTIMWPIEGFGRVMLGTTRLIERAQPYNLLVELARGQLMRISQKREDWGLYDYAEGAPVYGEIERARKLLVQAITAQDDATVSRYGEAALAAGVAAGERLGVFHAAVFLARRRTLNQLSKRPLGCRLDVTESTDQHVKRLSEVFDFASVPLRWRSLQPEEGGHQPQLVDRCLQWLRQRRIPAHALSLLSLNPADIPEWLPAFSRDYGQFRDCVTRHLRFVLKHFRPHFAAWEAVTGLHAQNPFNLSFEQIMELTRLSTLAVRQSCPKSTVLVGLILPWGEYYAQNSKTIPPLLYAEMVLQSGISFDAFGLDLSFGQGALSSHVRDMMQVSSLLDRLGSFGKAVHITSAGVPARVGSTSRGCWRGEWSDQVQAQWARDFYQIALSKPFVESVSWQSLADPSEDSVGPGVFGEDLSPKPACEAISTFRRQTLDAATPNG